LTTEEDDLVELKEELHLHHHLGLLEGVEMQKDIVVEIEQLPLPRLDLY
jgi:hypothetical protein